MTDATPPSISEAVGGEDSRLRLIVERIERLIEEKKGIADDIRDCFAEAKAVGYDTRVLRQVIARRAMKPDDRAEADAMIEVYEAALGGLAPDPAVSPDEAKREMAIAILADQIEGIQDPATAAQLAEHVSVLIDLRAEIADLRRLERERKKLAEVEGFEKGPLSQLVRWIEKCAKFGEDMMRAGESVFQLYRGTIEARGIGGGKPVSGDETLQNAFGKQSKSSSKADDKLAAWLLTGKGG